MVTYVVLANNVVQYVGGSASKAFSIGKFLKQEEQNVLIEIWEAEELVYKLKITLGEDIK